MTDLTYFCIMENGIDILQIVGVFYVCTLYVQMFKQRPVGQPVSHISGFQIA